MMKAIQNNASQNIPSTITPQDINIVFTHIQCAACSLGKRNKLPVNVGSGISPTSPGHTISFDYQPVTTKSITGHTGYFLFKCLYSEFRYSAFVTFKSAASLISSLDSVCLFFLSHGHHLVKVRCDSGSSELSEEFSKYLLQHHITLDPAAVNSQFQNPVEREVQTVNKGVATLFADQHLLTPAFWPYAVQFWIHTANSSPMSSDISPLELVTNVVPDISTTFRFPFGCPVTSSKEGPKVALTHAKSEIGIALGTSSGSNKSVLIYIPGRGIKPFNRLNVQLLHINFPYLACINGFNPDILYFFFTFVELIFQWLNSMRLFSDPDNRHLTCAKDYWLVHW
jgi:hypothetical protein